MDAGAPSPDGHKTFVITGGNSGLGFETARLLAAESPANTVVLGCRKVDRGEEARRAISEATGNDRVRVAQLDLASLASVRTFVTTSRATLDAPIDALICNAGISRGPARTVDGIDAVFETNHLGHFLLTLSLLGAMAPAGRILVVSSDMHQPPGPVLRWPGAEALAYPSGRISSQRYSYSKLGNLYFVHELSRRLRAEGSGVSVAAFNPGLMTETNFAAMPRIAGALLRRVFASRVGSLDGSAAALARLALAEGAAEIDGLYFDRTADSDRRSSPLSYDTANARDLWSFSDRLTDASG